MDSPPDSPEKFSPSSVKFGLNRYNNDSSISVNTRFHEPGKKKHNNSYLHNLRRAFDEADIGKNGYLTFEQWHSSKLIDHLRNGSLGIEQFDLFFSRIDANSDGVVTWEELISFILKDCDSEQSLSKLTRVNPIQRVFSAPFSRNNMHREICTMVQICNTTDEYISLSPDSIHFWKQKTLQHTRSISDIGNFISLIIFETQMLMVVCTSTRRILFHDLDSLTLYPTEITASPSADSIRKMSKYDAKSALDHFDISSLPLFNIPQVMHPATFDSSTEMVFFVTDDQGFIEVFFVTNPRRRQGSDFVATQIAKHKMHKSSITHIESIKYKRCYATSSTDCTVKFWTFDSHSKVFHVIQTYTDTSSVSFFYYHDLQNTLITCGVSRDAYVWSQTTQKRIFKLGGHYSQVIGITKFDTSINDRCILTMTNRKEFKIWDGVNYRLLREWNDPNVQRPENRYGAMVFDSLHQCLITVSSVPSKWQEDTSSNPTNLVNSTSSHSIIACLYSSEFDQIINVDALGNFMVWEVKNGNRTMMRTENWVPDSFDVSCAVLDVTERRLITSTMKGSVSIWNFNMGSVISDLDFKTKGSPIPALTSGVIVGRQTIVRAGADRTIAVFCEYEKGEFELYRMFSGCESDITCLISFPVGIISGCSNGELFSWALDSSRPIAETAIFNGASIEAMTIVNSCLIVGDSRGFVHIYSIPKLIHYETLQNCHRIYTHYSLTSIAGDNDNHYVFSADTLGYVKKWRLQTSPRISLEDITIRRCCNDELTSVGLIRNNQLLVTCGFDMCVRIWDATNFDYLNFLHQGVQWSISNTDTWKIDCPFASDPIHFTKKEQKLTTMQTRSMRQFPAFLVSGRAPTNIPSKVNVVQPSPKNEKKEEKPFNYEQISETFYEYLSTPQVDIRETVLFDFMDRDLNTNTTLAKSSTLKTSLKPMELFGQFDNLFSNTDSSKGRNERAMTANIVRPQIKTPGSSTKMSRIPLHLGIR